MITINTSFFLKVVIAVAAIAVTLAVTLSSGLAHRQQTTTWRMSALPDTGQTTSYTDIVGEDSDYSNNPLSYTVNSDNTVITDNVTGLVWQQNSTMTASTIISAEEYCNDTISPLGGVTDWRLPTSHELFSLVDLSATNPPFSSTYFTNSDDHGYWWSSTEQADVSGNYWVVNSGGGTGPKPPGDNFYMRCVRDDLSSTITQTFTSNGDNTVTESSTWLMWQQDGTSAISTTWTAALTYCESLTLADYSDWRLPNTKELRSISDDDDLVNPSVTSTISITAIKNTDPNDATGYWSSSTLSNNDTQAWIVDFYNGLTTHSDKENSQYIICTRNATTVIYLPIVIKE